MQMTLLIVEDNPIVREALRMIFTTAGVTTILEADSCTEAAQTMREQEVDVVLLDLRFRSTPDHPEEDGLDFLCDLRNRDRSTPVVIHSHNHRSSALCRSHALRANGFVCKDGDKDAVLTAVRDAAAGKNLWTPEQLDEIAAWSRRPSVLSEDRDIGI